MSRDIGELFPERPEARLRIYAWSPNDPPAGYAGLLKVGQTTKTDVNVRIRESQGQMQQAYMLHVDELAERGDGSVFRDLASIFHDGPVRGLSAPVASMLV